MVAVGGTAVGVLGCGVAVGCAGATTLIVCDWFVVPPGPVASMRYVVMPVCVGQSEVDPLTGALSQILTLSRKRRIVVIRPSTHQFSVTHCPKATWSAGVTVK